MNMGKRHEGSCKGKKNKIMKIIGRSQDTAQRICDLVLKKED